MAAEPEVITITSSLESDASTIEYRDDRQYRIEWEQPFLSYCRHHGLKHEYFDLPRIRQAFIDNHLDPFDNIMREDPKDPLEKRLRQFNGLKNYRLYFIARRYPTQEFLTLTQHLEDRSKALAANGQAVYSQIYGNIKEMIWRKKSQVKLEIWQIAVSPKTSEYSPEKILHRYEKTNAILYDCVPFKRFLREKTRSQATPAEMLQQHSKGEGTLLNVKTSTYPRKPVYSILSREIANQLTSDTINFVDVHNGMVLWIKGRTKISKCMFYVLVENKRCVLGSTSVTNACRRLDFDQ
ncbi:hypothetical protein B566_EDAN012673 [Ephemera danica]|nr:hypothetical protein B566_EDAN012673 [Ephemera danica]